MHKTLANPSFERAFQAVELVRERLRRATTALEAAGVRYAVIGGNAIAAWVAQVDTEAVRNTKDVDILLRREDLPMAIKALERNGFVYRHTKGVDFFLDGPEGRFRSGIHIVFANEKVHEDSVLPSADVTESIDADEGFRALKLDALLQMKLTSFRDTDRVHIRDLISVGLVDRAWLDRVPAVLRTRFLSILDNPEDFSL